MRSRVCRTGILENSVVSPSAIGRHRAIFRTENFSRLAQNLQINSVSRPKISPRSLFRRNAFCQSNFFQTSFLRRRLRFSANCFICPHRRAGFSQKTLFGKISVVVADNNFGSCFLVVRRNNRFSRRNGRELRTN